jgi:hypothetical protein
MVLSFIHLQPAADPDKVPQSVVRHLGEVYCPLIIGLQACAIALMLGYKITRKTHEETLVRLAAEAEAVREAAGEVAV